MISKIRTSTNLRPPKVETLHQRFGGGGGGTTNLEANPVGSGGNHRGWSVWSWDLFIKHSGNATWDVKPTPYRMTVVKGRFSLGSQSRSVIIWSGDDCILGRRQRNVTIAWLVGSSLGFFSHHDSLKLMGFGPFNQPSWKKNNTHLFSRGHHECSKLSCQHQDYLTQNWRT